MVQSMSGVTLMFLLKNIFMLISAAFLITDRHVKSLLTVLNMDDASETDISVAFGEHLLGLLAPGKTYRVDGRSKGKRRCQCGCDAFPAFNNTGIGMLCMIMHIPENILIQKNMDYIW